LECGECQHWRFADSPSWKLGREGEREARQFAWKIDERFAQIGKHEKNCRAICESFCMLELYEGDGDSQLTGEVIYGVVKER
jgi:hypothetical protein